MKVRRSTSEILSHSSLIASAIPSRPCGLTRRLFSISFRIYQTFSIRLRSAEDGRGWGPVEFGNPIPFPNLIGISRLLSRSPILYEAERTPCLLTLPIPEGLENWGEDIVDITSRSYCPPIVPISEDQLTFLFPKNATPYHYGVLLGELGDKAIIIILLPGAPGDPNSTSVTREPDVTLVSSNHPVPILSAPILVGLREWKS